MLSPQLRRKVYNLWTMFWSSGITNPLTAIEQITYLLFLKHLEVLDERRVQQGKTSIYAVAWQGEKRTKDGTGRHSKELRAVPLVLHPPRRRL